MKRFITLFSMLVVVVLTATADPAERGIWKTVRLADGRTVRVELRGDEYMSYWQSENGERFVQRVGDNVFVPADMNALRRNAAELRLQDPLPQPLATVPAQSRISLGGDHPAYVGQKKGLVVLAEFTDMKFRDGHDAEYYTHVLNDLNFSHKDGFVGSVHDYFLAQSDGLFDLTFDVVGPIQLKNDMAYYGAQTSTKHDVNAKAMALEAAQAASKQLGTFANYDWFGDGYVDQIFIIYAGRGQSSGGDANTIWPHRSSISAVRLGGKIVKVYACANEMHSETMVHGIGTFCHEFSHCLGLPDLYDTKGSETDEGKNYGMGYWDLMASGAHLNNNFRPCAYSGVERAYCGWKEPVVLTGDTIIRNLKGISEGGDFFIIRNDAHPDEYYTLENRSQKGWDSAQYGSGLLICHVDYDKTIWAGNIVNAEVSGKNDHERYSPFVADNSKGTKYTTDIAGDLYPSGRNNFLTNYSKPAAELFNANEVGEYYMSKPVTNIVCNTDKTVSFCFANEVGKEEDPLPEGVFFRETFCRTNGIGGKDDIWNPAAMEMAFLIADNLGWTFNIGTGAGECVIVGSNARAGVATSPEFVISAPAVVSCKTAAYGTEGSTTLTLSATGATLGTAKFGMTVGQWTACTTTLTAETYPAKCTLTFKNNKKRFFLDEIFVSDEENSGIENVTMDSGRKIDGRIYTIDGRKVQGNARNLAPGIYIRNGKKFRL